MRAGVTLVESLNKAPQSAAVANTHLTSLGWNELCVAGAGTSRKAMDCCPSFHWGLSGQLSLEAEEWELALLNSTNEATSTDPVSWKRVTAVALPPCSQQRERKKREGKKERGERKKNKGK